MNDTKENAMPGGWYAVARSADAVGRHVLHAQLSGQELAIWRDDEGNINAWENRCPHRGVRLSIGTNTGTELQCRYHGWRYESGSGQCRFIPAHPDQTPPKAVKARPYGCVDKSGFIWVNLAGNEGDAGLEALEQPGMTLLRSVFVDAPAALVAHKLSGYRFAPQRGAPVVAAATRSVGQFALEAIAASVGGEESRATVVFMVQPVDRHTACIHGAVVSAVPEREKLAVQLHHNRQLSSLRKQLEDQIPA